MDVVTIGETMVLFEANERGLLQYDQHFQKSIGGAESNVAIGLSKLGHKSSWISKLGNDPFGKYIYSYLKGEGVDVSGVHFTKEKQTSVFFKESGKYNLTNIYYYRNDSAASTLMPEDIDENHFKGTKYLHISGITPALSKSCHETILYAVKLAKENGVKIIFDPNIRYTLWNENEYINVMKNILKDVNYFLPGEDELKSLFPNKTQEEAVNSILDKGVEAVVIKKGKKGASIHTKDKSKDIGGYPNDYVVDPVGAGDGFASGFISGLLDELNLEAAVQRGNIVGSMVTMVKGDCEGLPNREDMQNFLNEQTDIKR